MTKNALRKKYKALRNSLPPDRLDAMSVSIANKLLSLEIWEHSFYHIFLPIMEQKEINTEYILNILMGKDKQVLMSKSDFETRKMKHYLLTDATTIQKNRYDIPEPIDGIEVPVHKIDVVFVPLLAFDKKGNRVGYGKGFYDNFLSQCREDSIKIGLSFFEAEAQIADVFENDIPLDYCVTPDQIYAF